MYRSPDHHPHPVEAEGVEHALRLAQHGPGVAGPPAPVPATGNSTVTVVPAPGSLPMSSRPSWAATSWLTTVSPIPLPVTPWRVASPPEALDDVVELVGGDARPLVAHHQPGDSPAPRRTLTVTPTPDGENLGRW